MESEKLILPAGPIGGPTYKFLQTHAQQIVVCGERGELLRITPQGEVIAPSLEAASEAGRVFVESIRHHLKFIGEAR